MPADTATSLISETDELLGRVRRAVLTELQRPGTGGELRSLAPLAGALRTAASGFGFEACRDDLERLERELGRISIGEPVPEERTNLLLDLIASIEAAMGQALINSDAGGIDFSDLLEGPFEFVLVSESEPEPEAVPAAADEDEFEIDAEMLEVFAMEAEDLLRSIETQLETLEGQPGNKEALWEIRRNAHTLKGAAGIVGLKKPSKLAHRVEDLLDRLAEANAGSNDRIFVLLRTAAECLRRLTAGDNSPELNERISKLYLEFDALLSSIAAEEPIPEAAPELQETGTEEPQGAGEAAAARPEPLEVPEQVKPLEVSVRPRSIVRVSLERLDELVKNVRDLVVTRSVFEQRLGELERQIDELQNSTRRLRSTCAKFEIDFEASMLERTPAVNHFAGTVETIESFDSLEFDRYTEFHQSTRVLSETTNDAFAIKAALDGLHRHLDGLYEQQRRLIDEMQERLMRIRMVEFGALATRLQRAVRVTCDEENKKAEVTIENAGLEIDTQILDGLIEPLMHLLKNAVVHGIEPPETRRLLGKPETGRIELELSNEDTHIILSVRDDGRGIAAANLKEKAVRSGYLTPEEAGKLSEEEVYELIFLPGLTTAEKLNLSAGRGVGMNIVKESIEAQKGSVSIESEPQKGTTFTLRVPLPLAVTNVVLVKVFRQTFAVPVKQLEHIAEVAAASVTSNGAECEVSIGAENLKFARLSDLAGFPASDQERDEIDVLLIGNNGKRSAVAVDEVIRSEEIVIKPFEKPLDSIKGLLGAAILGSGELVPILDMPALLKYKRPPEEPRKIAVEEPEEIIVMVVDDSPSVRHMTSKVIENAGWKPEVARDGVEAMEKLKAARRLPSVILSDIEMPRMDGYEMAVAISENPKLREIPVVFISSRSGEKHREKATAAGITEYLTKPFNEADLTSTVKRLAKI